MLDRDSSCGGAIGSRTPTPTSAITEGRVRKCCIAMRAPNSSTMTCMLQEVAQLGVTCVHTPRGMTWASWQEGLDRHSKQKGPER